MSSSLLDLPGTDLQLLKMTETKRHGPAGERIAAPQLADRGPVSR